MALAVVAIAFEYINGKALPVTDGKGVCVASVIRVKCFAVKIRYQKAMYLSGIKTLFDNTVGTILFPSGKPVVGGFSLSGSF